MCGIAGIISFKDSYIDPIELVEMGKSIYHRGPDDEGYVFFDKNTAAYKEYAGESSSQEIKLKFPSINAASSRGNFNVGLVHRRFSIIDLSSAGHQPFFNHEKDLCLLFNGEIFNYIELRNILQEKGVKFYTNSDSEVLLASYKEWGTESFNLFNGFWSFVIYDLKNNKLIFCRDRIGKKPLYYCFLDNVLYFASEIKALLKVKSISRKKKVNEKQLNKWLLFGLKDTDSNTFFEEIYSFPASSFLEIKTTFEIKNITKYWNIPERRFSESQISIPEAKSKVREILSDAIKLRLRADVPISVELSGGMDSSTIVALASDYRQKITTYTVKFDEKAFNEEPFARSVAERFNTNYRVLENPILNFWSGIKDFTYLEEEPYHSPNLQTNQEIWGEMRAEGTKVSLNGAAGDELFAGYGNYYAYAQIENLRNLDIRNFLSNRNWTENNYQTRNLLIPFYIYLKKFKFIYQFYKAERFGSGNVLDFCPTINPYYYKNLSDFLIDEFKSTKIPYWLKSGDIGFMGVPVELRQPFLDYRLVEYVMQLPVSYLIRDGWHKWILRKAMSDILPEDVVWRKNKLGFPFPYQSFIEGNKEIIELIIEKSNNPYLVLNKNQIFLYSWQSLSFILWYEYFFNENFELFEKIEELGKTYSLKKYVPQFQRK